MTDESKPAGDLIDSLGVTISLDGDELVSDAVVVLKVHGSDGAFVKVLTSPATDWITKRALLDIAAEEEHGPYQSEDDE